jgi:hypothetical protein
MRDEVERPAARRLHRVEDVSRHPPPDPAQIALARM